MNKILSVLLLAFLLVKSVFASEIEVYQKDNKFGLKNSTSIITDANYKKLIKLGEMSYIALKDSKYGIIDTTGNVILDFKFSHANRILGKYVKLQNYKGIGLYNEHGKEIIPQDFDSIELLPQGMLLVSNDYKYGIRDFNGKVLIENVCDDIYMPKKNVMRIKYNGEWFEIEQIDSATLMLPENIKNIKSDTNFKITKLVTKPITTSKYAIVALTDYSLKIFSSISPAYENTIDELMLSQGAEAVSIIMKINWLPKFPFVYAKNYYKTYRNPQTGPLSAIKNNIKHNF